MTPHCVMLRHLSNAKMSFVKNPHAVALGRIGGAKGGRERALRLSSERRREIARAASAARWANRLPDLLRPAFWNYNFDELRVDEHRDLIFQQVLSNGTADQLAWLRRRYGDPAIETWIRARKARGLTADQVATWIPRATTRRWHRADPNSSLWETRP